MKFRTDSTGIPMAARLMVLAMIVVIGGLGEAETGKGELTGVVVDPTGRSIAGAIVTATSPATSTPQTTQSDSDGRYRLELPAGRYQVRVSYSGFAPWLRDVTVEEGKSLGLDVTLRISPRKESVTVASRENNPPLAATQREVSASERVRSHNAAQLLSESPGINLRQNGELATIPMLHGLGEEQAKVVVNGVTVSNACANHMNPPLSYIAPSSAAEVTVMAGITPVSMGGDSLGGTISVDSPLPVFANANEGWHSEGTISSFFRSNGENYGPALSAWVGNHHSGIGYGGYWVTADDYTDGSGHKVTSTYAQTTDHVVTLAAQGSGNLVVLQAGLHHTPYQGFPDAQMDMVRNYAESLNLRYKRDFDGGVLDARVFWQGTWHSMNIGHDKATFPMPMWMPMNTHGRDFGYTSKLDIPFGDRHNLRLGSEFHRFVLDDDWPAVPGTAPDTGPNSFVSINHGRRSRLAWFGEVASKWNAKWSTLFGVRNDTVWMKTGQVSGYSDMYAADADAFNAVSHTRTDINVDATALARYEPNRSSTFEIGYARKTRTPNLYERYAWSTNWMASGMIGWFGDGNYYVGNLDLKPEAGHSVSASASWHDPARKQWGVKVTPYQTYISNYIDVDTLATTTYGASTFAQLRFANHDARIYGVDASGKVAIWDDAKFGRVELNGIVGYLHGERLDHGTDLYQIMPLNARVGFDEKLKRWTAGIQIQAVDRKSDVDPRRYEQQTPGYALLGLHSGYERGHVRFDAGCDNLLNKSYALPLGGVNFDDFMASGWTSQIKPLTGRGRSFYVGLTMRY
jgi:iron complex outermembrane receptor protein